MRSLAGVCAVVLLSVSACGGEAEPVTKATPSPSPSVSIPGMTHPSERQQAAFLRDVQAISPGMASNSDRAVRRGRDVCLSLAESRKLAVSNLRKAEGLSSGDAERVVAAAKRNFCP
jgi:uncharacterized protein YoaH (UPF0181 family)